MKHLKLYEDYSKNLVQEYFSGAPQKSSGGGISPEKLEIRNKIVYPAEEFSRQTGIEVYQNWNIPGEDQEIQDEILRQQSGLTGDIIEKIKRGDKSPLQPIESLWREFVRRNPQISSWPLTGNPLDEARKKLDIMYGMVSRFNEDDILFYNQGNRAFSLDPESQRRKKEIERKSGSYMAWIPSPETLDFIEKNLK